MNKINSMIGFAMKSGNVSSGTLAAKTSIIRRRAHLLVLSNDMSEKTREVLIACCQKQKIPWLVMGNKYELGKCVGKAYRVALTINDFKMANSIIELINSAGEKCTGVVEWPK